jgi:enamine deaminase RidA (YjgF/YER057c/UK114 family)
MKKSAIVIVAVMMLLGGVSIVVAGSVEMINSDFLAPSKTYSHGSLTDKRFLDSSGFISNNASGGLVGIGDMRAQTEQVLGNIWLLLYEVGMDPTNITKVRVHIAASSKAEFAERFAIFNSLYAAFFAAYGVNEKDMPPRESYGPHDLPKELWLEVSVAADRDRKLAKVVPE